MDIPDAATEGHMVDETQAGNAKQTHKDGGRPKEPRGGWQGIQARLQSHTIGAVIHQLFPLARVTMRG